MLFTPIHRALGLAPSPLTDEIVEAAVAAGVAETQDLDWKKQLPPEQNLHQTDFPKDVAAMANSGGGVIVFGVTESSKKAEGRHDVGELSERHEKTLRAVAVSAISPPVFGLDIVRLGIDPRAVAVIVPAGVDGPHLIYRNDYFGAPIRVDADTHWMRERELEAAYSARLEERGRAGGQLDELYQEVLDSRGVAAASFPWMVCVARPRMAAQLRRRLIGEQVEGMWSVANSVLAYADPRFPTPTAGIDTFNPRAGLRRLIFRPNAPQQPWTEAWLALHDSGAVTLAGVVTDRPVQGDDGVDIAYERVRAVNVEAFVAEFMALVKASGQHHQLDEFDVQLGIEWASGKQLLLETVDSMNYTFSGTSVPLARYSKVPATVSTQASSELYHHAVHNLALDAVNQGGIARLRMIHSPPPL
ncbi:hypothetical protein GCM10022399_37400 [Terrabacter ginsenosidimutans]|uniref:Schlafen AlbA-2 domain-containing protein n=1 Tax=Terrabacter ginsenosidimutans TaxID=490575 RepID=A0ABP7EEB3_9MICO